MKKKRIPCKDKNKTHSTYNLFYHSFFFAVYKHYIILILANLFTGKIKSLHYILMVNMRVSI